ncbi:MAG: long-chain fatty acid--CoA ligase [Nitrospirae bacterium]|nr:MAG: long-chain fatty acid--CoA ligase [Nitrospirota bacterium]
MRTAIGSENAIFQARKWSRAPYPLPYSTFGQLYDARMHNPHWAGRPFLSFYDEAAGIHRTYTYEQFALHTDRLLTVLRDQIGVRRSNRIATLLFNHDHTVMVYCAAWILGAVVVPLNIEESDAQKRYILEHSEADYVVCWQEDVEAVRALCGDLPRRPRVVGLPRDPHRLLDLVGPARRSVTLAVEDGQDSDEALIVYTSGTTGAPKGVLLTINNLLTDARAIAEWHGFQPTDGLMCVLPLHHVNGIVVTLVTPLYYGGRIVLNRKFHVTTFWPRIQAEAVHCVSVVPTILEFLLERSPASRPALPERFAGLICGAGPLLKETARTFEDRFRCRIRHGYGLSETTCYSCFLPVELSDEEHRRWLTDYEFPSIGTPLPCNDMAILDEQGQPAPPCTPGEIGIRGQTVCSGYLKRPDANAAAFRGGWFRSGDAGWFINDERGRPYFFITGRLKELIIRGGVNISPLEIDEVLRQHPAVRFAMAIPFDHRFYGEEIAAYIVLHEHRTPPSQEELLRFYRRSLPFAKCPKVIVFGGDVPYTTTGKPKRLALKTRLADRLAAYRNRRFVDDYREGTHEHTYH